MTKLFNKTWKALRAYQMEALTKDAQMWFD